MDRSLITDMPRDKYVERCKQRPSLFSTAAILKTRLPRLSAIHAPRPDCELPHHLAALGVLLLMGDDALGWRTLIEGFR